MVAYYGARAARPPATDGISIYFAVQNASYGLTLCAECGLVSALVAGAHGPLRAVSVTAGDGRPLAPCGRCRQVLLEHGGGEILVDAGEGREPVTLAALLPGAFDAGELASRRSS